MDTKTALFPDFRPGKTLLSEYFLQSTADPCRIICDLNKIITDTGSALPYDEYDEISEGVWMHISAYMASDVKISSPSIICKGAKLRHGSVIVSSVIGQFAEVGENSVIKRSIIFDLSEISTCVSVMRSVVGYSSRIGAGAVLTDTNQNHETVRVSLPYTQYYAETNEMGSFLGACSRVGENAVLSPGTVVESGGKVYPLTYVNGYVPCHAAKREARRG